MILGRGLKVDDDLWQEVLDYTLENKTTINKTLTDFLKLGLEARNGATGKRVVLNSDHLEKLQEVFGFAIRDADHLTTLAQNSRDINISDEFKMELDQDTLYAIKQMAEGMDVPFEDYVKQFISESVYATIYGSYAPLK